MGSTMVVTGASRFIGESVMRRLVGSPEVDRVVGVDTSFPAREIPGAEFVRCDLTGPVLGRVLAQTRADTVVHLSLSEDSATARGARLSQRESNVFGSLRLLASVQAQRAVRRVVLKSTASVYGSSASDSAFFTEDAPVRATGSPSAVRDAIEVEEYVRGVSDRRADISTCVLRPAHIVGPGMRTPFMEYLTAPLVPVPIGFDARIQVLHQEDAVAALCAAALGDATGTINVAADGVVTLSSAVRRVRRIPVPLAPMTGRLWNKVPGAGRTHIANEDRRYLYWGRCLDTRRMRCDLGFEPEYSSAEALMTIAPQPASDGDVFEHLRMRGESDS